MSVWNTMSQIDIRSIQEKKQGFTYLSWSHALRLLKEHVPHAKVVKHTFDVNGVMLPYMRDEGGFAYVMVTVDLGDGDVTTEIMPVLNHANRPIANPNSFEVNAQLQRCMAKAISMATGLGIHLYAGEDVPRKVEAVGGDNSSQQAASGSDPVERAKPEKSMSGSNSNFDNNKAKEVKNSPAGSQQPVSIDALRKIAPDIETLKSIFYARQDDLTPEDKMVFSARKKELING